MESFFIKYLLFVIQYVFFVTELRNFGVELFAYDAKLLIVCHFMFAKSTFLQTNFIWKDRSIEIENENTEYAASFRK